MIKLFSIILVSVFIMSSLSLFANAASIIGNLHYTIDNNTVTIDNCDKILKVK